MASINISQEEFAVLAEAANDAKQKGDIAQAEALDKLARKVNASLSNAGMAKYRIQGLPAPKGMTWEEAPSTLLK